MPTRNSWLTYETWGREYGDCHSPHIAWWSLTAILGSDIIYLHVLGIHIIVLNSLKAINEVLEKRSSIYSSRYELSLRYISS